MNRTQPPPPGKLPDPGNPAGGDRRLTWIFLGLLVSVPLVFFLLFRREGLGLSPDSIAYLSAAENLARGRGLALFDSRIFTRWPPLYPALLAALSAVMQPMTAAVVLGAACVAGAMAAAFAWAGRTCGRPAGLAAAFIAGPAVVFYLGFMVGTDPLFLALALAAMAALDRFRDTGRGLILAGVFSALACLARYPGVALVAAGAVILTAGPGRGTKRAVNAGGYLLVSLAPLGLWLARNHHLTGTLTGPRLPSSENLGTAIYQIAQALPRWAWPAPVIVISWQHYALLAAGAALVIGSALLVEFRGRPETKRFCRALLLLCLCYGATLANAVATVQMDRPNDRLIAPLLLPALLLVVAGWSSLPLVRPSRAARAAMVIGLILLPAALSLKTVKGATTVVTRGPSGYNSRAWRSSKLAQWVRENRLPPPLYSNEPPALYWLAGQVSFPSPIRPSRFGKAGSLEDPAWQRPGARTLVLFKRARLESLTAKELERAFSLIPLAEFDDGAAFLALPRPAPEENKN